MRTICTALMVVAALALQAGAGVISDWELIDDFQGYATGTVVATGDDVTGGEWTAHNGTIHVDIAEDPDENKYIRMGSDEGAADSLGFRTASHVMDSGFQLAAGGGKATYFMRVRHEAGLDELLFGIAKPGVVTTQNQPTWNDYRVVTRINADGSVDVRNGSDYDKVTGITMPEDEWANFWMVVDRPEGTTGGTWDLYMTTGNDSAVGETALQSGINFRIDDSQALATVLLTTAGQGEDALLIGHFDDIYYSGGENLTLIPEPATMGLIALGGVGLLLKRRRRA